MIPKAPRFWKLGYVLHENLPLWQHQELTRRNLIPAAVKEWMCASFDYAIYGELDDLP